MLQAVMPAAPPPRGDVASAVECDEGSGSESGSEAGSGEESESEGEGEESESEEEGGSELVHESTADRVERQSGENKVRYRELADGDELEFYWNDEFEWCPCKVVGGLNREYKTSGEFCLFFVDEGEEVKGCLLSHNNWRRRS